VLAGRGKVGIASCRTEAQKRVFYGRLWFSSNNRCTHGVVEDLNMYTRICLVVYLGTRAFLSGLPTGSPTKGSSATPPRAHNPRHWLPNVRFHRATQATPCSCPPPRPAFAWLARAHCLPAPSFSSYSRHTTRSARQKPRIPLTSTLPRQPSSFKAGAAAWLGLGSQPFSARCR